MDFSPFNRLSAELRNHIYELVLLAPGPLSITFEGMNHFAYGWNLVPQQGRSHRLALTRACKQIRHETVPMFLAGNRFRILAHLAIGSSDDHGVEIIALHIHECWAAFGAYATCMGNLEIFLGDHDDDHHDKALSLRLDLIKQLSRLFKNAGVRPSVTMELQLSGGSTGRYRFYVVNSATHSFAPIPPVKLDLTRLSILENWNAIEHATGYARHAAMQSGWSTREHIAYLEKRRKRAIYVLKYLTQDRIKHEQRRINQTKAKQLGNCLK